jgi:hypothetical protein
VVCGHGRNAEPLREREAGSIAERQALAHRQRVKRRGRQRVSGREWLHRKLLADGTQDRLRVATEVSTVATSLKLTALVTAPPAIASATTSAPGSANSIASNADASIAAVNVPRAPLADLGRPPAHDARPAARPKQSPTVDLDDSPAG